MKYCPQCNTQYSEAWLTFCTNDGSLLREDLSPPANPDWDPRIRETQYDDPSENATQWLPRDPGTTPGGWMAPDERPFTGPPQSPAPSAPWQPPAPPPYPRSNAKTQNPLAIASFVCGAIAMVFGWFCGFPILGPLALIFGIVALTQMRKSPQSTGKGFAIAGIIMGCINLVFYAFWILWMILSVAFG
ncbi:MAG TPA: DUF4190 domain-containing protein [Pyrinomonadaceae bacterium]|nr:DUF4190 domain-containing protein [Pyrinomonadaceae bacterium]